MDVYQRYLYLFLMSFSAAHSFQFPVGGREGWTLKPWENYNHWAGRMRFQVNDKLLFKYKKGEDSVLEVNYDDYEKCSTTNPIAKMDEGDSIFTFTRSGPFFFISGNASNCFNGEKLIIVVMAVRHRSPSSSAPSPAHPPSPGPSPSPAPSSPKGKAPAPAPAPALAPAPGNQPDGDDSPADGGEDGDGDGSPPHSLATSAWGPSVAVVSTVSVVLSLCFGGFVVHV